MKLRTIALLALLLVVACVAIGLRAVGGKEDAEAAPELAVTMRKPQDPASAVVQFQHARVDDSAGILAPFGPRLGRMADAFYDDLGVDIHVVTRNEADESIESQADRLFRERKIGAGAPTGGLLVALNPKLASARIEEVGYSLEGGLTDLHMSRIARDQLAPYTSYAIGTGFEISLGQLVTQSAAALLLLLIGVAIFRETLTLVNVVGIVLCVAGFWLIGRGH